MFHMGRGIFQFFEIFTKVIYNSIRNKALAGKVFEIHTLLPLRITEKKELEFRRRVHKINNANIKRQILK